MILRLKGNQPKGKKGGGNRIHAQRRAVQHGVVHAEYKQEVYLKQRVNEGEYAK